MNLADGQDPSTSVYYRASVERHRSHRRCDRAKLRAAIIRTSQMLKNMDHPSAGILTHTILA